MLIYIIVCSSQFIVGGAKYMIVHTPDTAVKSRPSYHELVLKFPLFSNSSQNKNINLQMYVCVARFWKQRGYIGDFYEKLPEDSSMSSRRIPASSKMDMAAGQG